jgi:hypothetical protein
LKVTLQPVEPDGSDKKIGSQTPSRPE